MVDGLKKGASTALVALAQKMALGDPVEADEVRQLVAALCADQSERVALLRACRQANDPDLKVILCDMLRSYATDCLAEAEERGGKDTVLGPWSQGIGISLLAFTLTSIVTANLAGPTALLAGAATLGTLVVATFLRLRLLAQRLPAKHSADRANDLVKAIGELKPETNEPHKIQRK